LYGVPETRGWWSYQPRNKEGGVWCSLGFADDEQKEEGRGLVSRRRRRLWGVAGRKTEAREVTEGITAMEAAEL
jgi:hypothetical protein